MLSSDATWHGAKIIPVIFALAHAVVFEIEDSDARLLLSTRRTLIRSDSRQSENSPAANLAVHRYASLATIELAPTKMRDDDDDDDDDDDEDDDDKKKTAPRPPRAGDGSGAFRWRDRPASRSVAPLCSPPTPRLPAPGPAPMAIAIQIPIPGPATTYTQEKQKGQCCRLDEICMSRANFAATPAECEQLCNENAKCLYFDHFPINNKCKLCADCDDEKSEHEGYALHTSWAKVITVSDGKGEGKGAEEKEKQLPTAADTGDDEEERTTVSQANCDNAKLWGTDESNEEKDERGKRAIHIGVFNAGNCSGNAQTVTQLVAYAAGGCVKNLFEGTFFCVQCVNRSLKFGVFEKNPLEGAVKETVFPWTKEIGFRLNNFEKDNCGKQCHKHGEKGFRLAWHSDISVDLCEGGLEQSIAEEDKAAATNETAKQQKKALSAMVAVGALLLVCVLAGVAASCSSTDSTAAAAKEEKTKPKAKASKTSKAKDSTKSEATDTKALDMKAWKEQQDLKAWQEQQDEDDMLHAEEDQKKAKQEEDLKAWKEQQDQDQHEEEQMEEQKSKKNNV